MRKKQEMNEFIPIMLSGFLSCRRVLVKEALINSNEGTNEYEWLYGVFAKLC